MNPNFWQNLSRFVLVPYLIDLTGKAVRRISTWVREKRRAAELRQLAEANGKANTAEERDEAAKKIIDRL